MAFRHLRLGPLALVLTLLAAAPTSAADLFASVQPADRALLTADQSEQLAAYKADPVAAEVSVVRLVPATLRAADGVSLNLPDLTDQPLHGMRVENRSPDEYTWYADGAGPGDSAILVVRGGDVLGTIRSRGRLYRVRPLPGGLAALIRIDEARLPPTGPPGQRAPAGRSERHGRALAPGTVSRVSCRVA